MERIFYKLKRYFYGQWVVGVLDFSCGLWSREPAASNIAYFKAQNAAGRHILIRPCPNIESYYMLADDLNWSLVNRHHRFSTGEWRPGRMAIETSPGNFQVWIHSSRSLPIAEKRYWLKKLHSDPGADPKHRWGRCPGFRNRKAKYRDANGNYPLSRLIWVDWKRMAEIPDPFSHLPRGGVCQNECLSRSHYERGDESATDFAYALALFRRGFTASEIRTCILSERSDWRHHRGRHRMENYLIRTLKRAQTLILSTRQKGRKP